MPTDVHACTDAIFICYQKWLPTDLRLFSIVLMKSKWQFHTHTTYHSLPIETQISLFDHSSFSKVWFVQEFQIVTKKSQCRLAKTSDSRVLRQYQQQVCCSSIFVVLSENHCASCKESESVWGWWSWKYRNTSNDILLNCLSVLKMIICRCRSNCGQLRSNSMFKTTSTFVVFKRTTAAWPSTVVPNIF